MAPRPPATAAEQAWRRQQLLEAAGWLLDRWSLPDISIDRIADRAGVAKGTVYRSFSTREELLLSLWEQEHELWFEDLSARTGRGSRPLTADRLGRTLAATALARPRLCALHGRARSELAHNLTLAAADRLMRQELRRFTEMAEHIASRVEGLEAAVLRRWLISMDAVAAGLLPLAARPFAVGRALEADALRELRLNVASGLRRIAVLTFEDLRRAEDQSASRMPPAPGASST